MARKLELELQAKSNADVVLNRVQKASQNFASNLTSKLTGAFGAMALFDKFTSFAVSNFQEFAGLADQISKSGLAADQFQQLAYAAKQSGADVKDVTKAVRELNGAIAEAKVNPESKKGLALKALGFSAEQISSGNIKATDVFLQLSKAMQKATSDAEKVSIATALLGDKVGQNLIPMLEDGHDALLKMFGDAPIVSDKALKSIDEASDKVDTMSAKIKGLSIQVQALGVDTFNSMKGWNLGPIGAALHYFLNKDNANAGVNLSPMGEPDAKALIDSQAKATAEANASLGSGVIGVGASPQIAVMMEQKDILEQINSGIGQLVKQSIDTDFTKSLARKYNLPAR